VKKKKKSVIVRLAAPEQQLLFDLMFHRYPQLEWACFGRFGWRDTEDALICTLAGIDAPQEGDLDDNVGHVAISEPYSLRIALAAEKHPLAVGVFHSHPHNCPPAPSVIDDDMDGYYSQYFDDFAKDRPYLSAIVTKLDDSIVISGRVFWHGEWLIVSRFIAERLPVQSFEQLRLVRNFSNGEKHARLKSAFGLAAAEKLKSATVAVIGAGGTGSMVIEILARAGVGKLIIIDPDFVTDSNLERLHGGFPKHALNRTPKVIVAMEHVKSIDPECEVKGCIGALPQDEAINAVIHADIAIGCTDQQHSRLSLSDLTIRYLIPAIDAGVMLEGADGRVTGQILQLVRFLASDPCVLCRDMVSAQRIAEELMSPEEKAFRQQEAENARIRGEDPNPYWKGVPQLNTVGYLTGTAGALAAGYVIGWITGRFDPPFERMQMNLVAPFLDVQNIEQFPRDLCACKRIRGWGDQAIADALITAPRHWPAAKLV
jgi:molybdopterin/thiamine biosynthesis adenylyltransferase